MSPRPPADVPTRDRIVDCALRLFSERGTGTTSMRDLAEAAGVTVPGLYYHFASKAELIQAVFAARGLDGVLTLEAHLDPDLPAPVAARVRARAEREFTRLVEEAPFVRLMLREAALGDPDALAVGRRLRDAWQRQWRDVLATAADVRSGADVDVLASCVTTFLWGLCTEYLTFGDASVASRILPFATVIGAALESPA